MKIVTALALKSWADTITVRAELPELVRSLIRASCDRLDYYRFPSGDASQTHGWDGVVNVQKGTSFVPDGRSIWEIGTGANYETKADEDFTKRTNELTDEVRRTTSFRFVTPRIWDTGLQDWERDHSNAGWQSVRIYDANALELWLADHPAVAVPLAKHLGLIPPMGVQTVDDFWEEYRLGFSPPLKESLLLTGRESRAKELCDGFSAGLPGLSKLQADSATEAAAFISAAILSAEREQSLYLSSKTLLINSEDAARQLPRTGAFNAILFPDAAKVGPAIARKNQVTLVLGTGDIAQDAQTLERMDTRSFAAGLQAMGIDEPDAFRLAGICGRSVTVLSRLNASATALPPLWRDKPELLPLILAGGWDASNEHDCAVVAQLAGKTYDEVDVDAHRFVAMADAPLDLEGTVWTARSSKDAFMVMAPLVGRALQQKLRDACLTVFAEVDRALDQPEEEQPMIPTRGADFRHSEWLRRGLSTTLLLISGLHEAARFRTVVGTPEQFVDEVVGSIPRLSEDIRVLASLKSEFRTLMEAAPLPLVSALERVLEGDNLVWVPVLYRDKRDQFPFGSTSPHTYVLWALETLAWNPLYLHRAASVLLQLADSDPGGRTQNRPLQSLRSIFLAWRPNTYASLEERIGVVRSICQSRPDVGLDLAISLLPVAYDHSTDTAKPRLRDFGESQSKEVKNGEARSAYLAYAELAVELAGTNVHRLIALVEHLPELDPGSLEKALAAMRTSVEGASPQDSFDLWSKLRALVSKHRSFQIADWAMKEPELLPLERLCEEISPKDEIRKIVWLFDDLIPEIGPPGREDYVGDANQKRSAALARLLAEGGIDSVLNLTRIAKQPYLVGISLGEQASDQHVLERAIEIALRSGPRGSEQEFAVAVSAVAHDKFGSSWDAWLSEYVKHLEPIEAARLLLRWSDVRKTWEYVAILGHDIELEYWKRKPAFRQESDADMFFALDKLISVERFGACLDMVSYQEHRVPTPLCVVILRGLIREINESKLHHQNALYDLVHMIQSLQQRPDIDTFELAGIEYQYLPLLEHQGEPVALQKLLNASPKFFVDVICDVFSPASGETGEITKERRLRANFGYKLLHSIKSLPGFSIDSGDISVLRDWIRTARGLGKAADREAITDQKIGEILAYSPSDGEELAWPARPIRDLIEELASTEIERGISVARFNMRGVFRRAMYEGGAEERTLADSYRRWAEMSRAWPRTCAMLRQIASDWDRSAERVDIETELDQRRNT